MTDRITRRNLLLGGGAALGGAALGLVPSPAGALGLDEVETVAAAGHRPGRGRRPIITHGVQSGDVNPRNAVVWSRTDRRARMWIDVSPDPSFRDYYTVRGPMARPAGDYTAQVRLTELPRDTDRIYYRVTFEDPETAAVSQRTEGSFATVPKRRDDVRFSWVGDCAGQGWGINPDFGGMRAWETMRGFDPQFCIFSGDTVYADGPLSEEVELRDGSIWRNVVTPEKAKVAETLDEFRGQWKYNLLDDNVRRFNAQVPLITQWDDHEVVNNWYPGEILTDPRYTVTDVDTLAARAARAFQEFMPIGRTPERVGRVYRKINYGPLLDVFVIDMRTFRAANSENLQTGGPEAVFLGREQIEWLLDGLANSRSTWKVIASDMPIGLLVPDGTNWEAVANGDNGEPLGRELEIAYLLGEMKRRGVEDTVWLTADVHYTAAHHYHPDRAAFKGFNPFWEFVTGPIHAGTFGPNGLDDTFGPEVVFSEAALYPNMPPSDGRQYFGVVDIDAGSKDLTVRLVNIAGDVLHTQVLTPVGS